MNWITENKFLTAFFAVMLVGVGALGFLLFSASTAKDDADTAYATQAAEYNRLRRLPLFPNAKNLKTLQAQKAQAIEEISAFQESLSKKEFPLEPMTPEDFQDKLKSAVLAVRAKAVENNVKLQPEGKFFLGFDIYESRPPERDAAAPLGRQLKAIEWVVNQCLASRVTELKVTRFELPEEGRAKTGSAPARRGEKAAKNLASKYPFDLAFTCRQESFVTILNTVVGPKAPQFYIPRIVQVKNQGKIPTKEAPPITAPAASGGAAGAPAAPAPIATYLVGEEQIDVSLRLEMVDFAEVATK